MTTPTLDSIAHILVRLELTQQRRTHGGSVWYCRLIVQRGFAHGDIHGEGDTPEQAIAAAVAKVLA